MVAPSNEGCNMPMGERKARVALTVPDDLMGILRDLGEVTEKPVATLIVELLGEMREQLVGITKFAKAAKAGNKAAAKRALVHAVGDSMASLMAEQMELPAVKKPKRK
jgi:hypothetical protein